GLTDLSHQPAVGQLGSIGPHRLQLCVLERGKDDLLRHAIGAHHVDRPLGQVRCMPFKLDMHARAYVIPRQHLCQRGKTVPTKHPAIEEPIANGTRGVGVWDATGPVQLVVRSTVSSCITTRWSSLVRCTSSSRWRALICSARSKAAKVFSGV